MTLRDIDAVIACSNLVDRAGGTNFEFGYVHDDVPSEDAAWWVEASWRGYKMIEEHYRSPADAANALSRRILEDAACRCGRMATLQEKAKDRCLWTLQGNRWKPGCNVDPIPAAGVERGNVEALEERMKQEIRRRERQQ